MSRVLLGSNGWQVCLRELHPVLAELEDQSAEWLSVCQLQRALLDHRPGKVEQAHRLLREEARCTDLIYAYTISSKSNCIYVYTISSKSSLSTCLYTPFLASQTVFIHHF